MLKLNYLGKQARVQALYAALAGQAPRIQYGYPGRAGCVRGAARLEPARALHQAAAQSRPGALALGEHGDSMEDEAVGALIGDAHVWSR